jgi:cellobiose epimerase
MITTDMLRTFTQDANREVRENILPFWLKLADPDHAGYYGEVSFTGQVHQEAAKGGILCARITWTFSRAYLQYHEMEYLSAAQKAYAFLSAKLWDHDHGGTFWSVDFQGRALDTRKMILAQSFTIYSLAEYYRATQESEALVKAIELFDLIEKHSRDPKFGGYFDAFDQTWQPLDQDGKRTKGMDPHLRVMMAFSSLLRVWDSPLLKKRLTEILEIFLDHLLQPSPPHLILSMTEDWQPTRTDFSYGHDIELVWLLSQIADQLADPSLRQRILPVVLGLANEVYRMGRDEDGAVFDKASPYGLLDENKIWWPQAESVVGFLSAYQLTGDERYYWASYKNWEWIQSYLVDRQNGDWHAQLTRDRRPVEGQNLVDLWKCPYHNSRCCFEVQERIGNLIMARDQNKTVK